ncbi:hypothetical protein [Erythrobacter sp. Alg231-14]|uniref:hypothetical protein n=1 Tax=Erythrobacter sp. Alg231-14 TaxID=1922225 RepID=UPI000D562C83
MRLSKHFDEQAQKRTTKRVREQPRKTPVSAHKSFVPVITAWGAALLGLSVLVLPANLVGRLSTLSGLTALGDVATYIFAAIAALLGAGLGYVVAAALREYSSRSEEKVAVVSAVSTRRVRPIDPVVELGSESLDAPIEEMPFGAAEEEGEFEELSETTRQPVPRQPTLGELSQRGYDIEAPEDCAAADEGEKPIFTRSQFKSALIETCEGATCEAAPAPQSQDREPAMQQAQKKPISGSNSNPSWSLTQFAPAPKPAPKAVPTSGAAENTLPEKPRALDLGEFAELPGRNGVWVEEKPAPASQDAAPQPAPRPVVQSVPQSAPVPAPAPSALEKLRQKPTDELSIVEMVERFAGALHDHQEAERKRVPDSGPSRDAALAEALKALTLFTERGFDQPAPQSTPRPVQGNDNNVAPEMTELGQTERELRDALLKLQSLRGAA